MNITESGELNHKNVSNGYFNNDRNLQEGQWEPFERRHKNGDRHYERPGNGSPNCRSQNRNRSYTNPNEFENDQRNGNERGSYARRAHFQNYRYPPQRDFNQHYTFNRQQDDNFRQRNFRKRNYQGRYTNDRDNDRRYSRPRFFQRPQFRGRPFNYRQDRQQNEFKVPRNMNNFQNKRRHLKYLRKTAAECAASNPGTFVYKPGMIGLLRPSTPMNTTQFLSKKYSFDKGFINEQNGEKDKISPKINAKQNSHSNERDCFSVCQEKYNLTIFGLGMVSRTPEPKHSPLNLSSNYDIFGKSHRSDNDAIFDEECISGTMEGLANYHMFDSDPIFPLCTNNRQDHMVNRININQSSIMLNEDLDEECTCNYKEKYENLKEQVLTLKEKLNIPDEYLSFLK